METSSKRKATTTDHDSDQEKKLKEEPIDLTSDEEEEEEEDRLQETTTFWSQLESAHKTAMAFEDKEFPRVKKIANINGFKLPWNDTLLVTRERHCTDDACHTDNEYPVLALELLKCFTKKGEINCSVHITYEPIEKVVYLHWDRYVRAKFNVLEHVWVELLDKKLREVGKEGQGFTLTDPRSV
jgi:hypothetical protein